MSKQNGEPSIKNVLDVLNDLRNDISKISAQLLTEINTISASNSILLTSQRSSTSTKTKSNTEAIKRAIDKTINLFNQNKNYENIDLLREMNFDEIYSQVIEVERNKKRGTIMSAWKEHSKANGTLEDFKKNDTVRVNVINPLKTKLKEVFSKPENQKLKIFAEDEKKATEESVVQNHVSGEEPEKSAKEKHRKTKTENEEKTKAKAKKSEAPKKPRKSTKKEEEPKKKTEDDVSDDEEEEKKENGREESENEDENNDSDEDDDEDDEEN